MTHFDAMQLATAHVERVMHTAPMATETLPVEPPNEMCDCGERQISNSDGLCDVCHKEAAEDRRQERESYAANHKPRGCYSSGEYVG